MLILVFLRMAAESAFYLTFAGLLAPVFRIEPAPLLLAVPILALCFIVLEFLETGRPVWKAKAVRHAGKGRRK